MSIDKKRYKAVEELERLGYRWDGADWLNPPPSGSAGAPGTGLAYPNQLVANVVAPSAPAPAGINQLSSATAGGQIMNALSDLKAVMANEGPYLQAIVMSQSHALRLFSVLAQTSGLVGASISRSPRVSPLNVIDIGEMYGVKVLGY